MNTIAMKSLFSLLFSLFTFFVLAQNPHFGLNPQTGCAPLSVDFVNNHPSNGYVPQMFHTTGYTYSWDFGNGQTSTLENPPTSIFQNPGQYEVNYKAWIDTTGYFLTNINIVAFGCDDPDVWPFTNDPDIFIVVIDGLGNEVFSNQSSPYTTANPPVSFSMNIPMLNPPFSVRVMDDDSPDVNDNCIDGGEHNGSTPLDNYLMHNDTSGFGQRTYVKVNGSLTFYYTVNKPVSYYAAADIITVHPQVPQHTITAIPDTMICPSGTGILLAPDGYGYEWFMDTLSLVNNDDTLIIDQTGTYSVRYYDTITMCEYTTPGVNIGLYPGVPAGFDSIGIFFQSDSLMTALSGHTYQWLYNGAAIAGQTNYYIVPSLDGNYSLVAYTPDACPDTSNVMSWTTGMQEFSVSGIRLYPNPASQGISVEYTNIGASEIEVRMLDITGRSIAYFNSGTSRIVRHTFQRNNLSSGMYFIHILQDGKFVKAKRFIFD